MTRAKSAIALPLTRLYIDPPLGRAGLTEAEVRKSGRRALIGRRPMTKVGRAVEKGETQGFMKIIVDAETHQILGAAILGTGGDEAIHSILDVMYARAPYTVIQRAVHIHPTVSELIPTMLGELQPLSDAAELRAVNGAGGARVDNWSLLMTITEPERLSLERATRSCVGCSTMYLDRSSRTRGSRCANCLQRRACSGSRQAGSQRIQA